MLSRIGILGDLNSKTNKKKILERPHDTWLSSFSENNTKPGPGDHVVEIWAKAGIGLYLWEHIFQGKLKALPKNGIPSEALRSGNVIFRFRTGPGLHPHKVPVSSRHVVLVLNGHDPSKLELATSWLNHLHKLPHLPTRLLSY